MTASVWDLPDVVALDQLGPLDAPISSGDGQSVSVSPLAQRPAFLFKQYKTCGGRCESDRLDELIRCPETLPAVTDVLRTRTSWPVARVRDPRGDALGCVIPRAPEIFLTEVAPAQPPQPCGSRRRKGGAVTRPAERRYLEVDLLAATPERLTMLGVPVPSLEGRMAAARSVVEIAAGLEKLRLVYSDWSYSNAFWSPRESAVFVIDVDGCAVGSTVNVYQPNWEDPLTPRSVAADTYVERYRVALLVARCLTGQRAVPAVVAKLRDTTSPVCGAALREVLLDMMLMQLREHRPSVSVLDAVLQGAPYVVFPNRHRFDVPVIDQTATHGPPHERAAGTGASGTGTRGPTGGTSTSPTPWTTTPTPGKAPGRPPPVPAQRQTGSMRDLILALLAITALAVILIIIGVITTP